MQRSCFLRSLMLQLAWFPDVADPWFNWHENDAVGTQKPSKKDQDCELRASFTCGENPERQFKDSVTGLLQFNSAVRERKAEEPTSPACILLIVTVSSLRNFCHSPANVSGMSLWFPPMQRGSLVTEFSFQGGLYCQSADLHWHAAEVLCRAAAEHLSEASWAHKGQQDGTDGALCLAHTEMRCACTLVPHAARLFTVWWCLLSVEENQQTCKGNPFLVYADCWEDVHLHSHFCQHSELHGICGTCVGR